MLGVGRWVHDKWSWALLRILYAYRVTHFTIWHLGKRQFNTVDECGILQLVQTFRRDLAQKDECKFCATST